jgi:hypothetical protein
VGIDHINCVPLSISILETASAAIHCLSIQGLRIVCCRPSDKALYVNSVQQLSPADIVRSLERSRKHNEALDAANKLGIQEREKISDTVESVKNICGKKSAIFRLCDQLQTTLTSLQKFLVSAMQVLQQEILTSSKICVLYWSLALSESIGLRSRPQRHWVGQIQWRRQRERLEALWYSSVHISFWVVFLTKKFHPPTFLHIDMSILELAICFAENSDMVGLSLLVTRHWELLTRHCEWILRIPPTLPPYEYAHLMPVIQEEKVLFISDAQENTLSDLQNFPNFLLERFSAQVVVDEIDEKTVFDSTAEFGASRHSLHEAYVSRARLIQAFTGSVEYAYQFSRMAVLSFGDQNDVASDSMDSIQVVNKEMEVLRNMLLTHPNMDNIPTHVLTLTAELGSAYDLQRLLSLAFDGSDNWPGMMQILDTLRPLLFMKETDGHPFDKAVISFCFDDITSLASARQLECQKLLHSASMCAAVSVLSRTSLPLCDRLVGDKFLLSKFVIGTIEECLHLFRLASLADMNLINLVDVLWVLYMRHSCLVSQFAVTGCRCSQWCYCSTRWSGGSGGREKRTFCCGRTVLEDTLRLFLDEKESSCACLFGVIVRQEKEAQVVRPQLDLFKNRNGEEFSGVKEIETRLNMVEKALHDVRPECDETTEKIAAERKAIGTNYNDNLMQPSCIKAKYPKVDQLGNIFKFLQSQLQAAVGVEKTTVQVAQKEESAALIDFPRNVEHGKEQYVEENRNSSAALKDMLFAVKKNTELLRCRLNALKGDAVAEKQDPPVEEEDSAGEEIDFEDMRKLFLDEKENACPCLLEVIARQEKEAQLVRSQFDMFNDRNGEERSGVKEMETRLNLRENALQDLHFECNGTVKMIAADRKGIGTSGNDLMQPTYIKAKYAKVKQLGTPPGNNRVEVERAAVVETLLEQTHKEFLDEKENSCACLLEVIARQDKEAELARSQLDLFKERNDEESGGVKEMETRLNLATRALHETGSDQQSSIMSPGKVETEDGNSNEASGRG